MFSKRLTRSLLLLQALGGGRNLRARQVVLCVCARLCVLAHSLFPSSLQMLITTGHQKVQTDTMKAYRKYSRNQHQYNYHQCQVGHMTSGNALLISMCILMLPLVQLSAEHVQLATMRHVNLTNQWCVHRHHMNVSHTPLVLPSLGNVLPAKVLQRSLVRLNISCPSYTSSHFSVCHIPPSLHLDLFSGLLGRRMVGVVLVLLLLLSGDIETNPGPVGECLF